MVNCGFVELEILNAVLNGETAYAKELADGMNLGERRIFTDQLRQTLHLFEPVVSS